MALGPEHIGEENMLSLGLISTNFKRVLPHFKEWGDDPVISEKNVGIQMSMYSFPESILSLSFDLRVNLGVIQPDLFLVILN